LQEIELLNFKFHNGIYISIFVYPVDAVGVDRKTRLVFRLSLNSLVESTTADPCTICGNTNVLILSTACPH